MSVANLNSDRTVNKIALCSAIVAGFAYVGYSVVRTAFTRRRKKKGDDVQHRVLLRRLSQTTQTDVLLGDLDVDGCNKVILRPKSVQERIKELNVRARQFADAVVAIQSNGNPKIHGVNARSLQVSPWGSPRLLSPVDIRQIIPSHSPDCLDHSYERDRSTPSGSPVRQRWSRNSFKSNRRVLIDFPLQEETRLKECEHLWIEERNEIINQLESLLGPGRVLTLQEAQYLIALLFSEDKSLVLETLTVIANCAAFTKSQDTLREAGLLIKLPRIIMQSDVSLQLKALQVVINMALNEKNIQEMRSLVSVLLHLFHSIPLSELNLLTATVDALTNIAVLSNWHKDFGTALHRLYSLLDQGLWNQGEISLQSLKLLINLSCNDEMVPSLMAAQAPSRLIYMMDMSMDEDVLLRLTTLLANLASAAKRMKMDPIYDLPSEDKAAAPDTMYAAIFGLSCVERMKRKTLLLSEQHPHEDVRIQADRLLTALSD